ncbi:MAG: hypothetical protein ACTHU0_05965 [Kofleriaceae bacterium]
MKTGLAVAFAVASLAGARGARELATDLRAAQGVDEPYAPSPGAAPILSLGYRELATDLLFIRLASYFGGEANTGSGVAGLVEAIVALDPHFRRIYEWGARAMTAARSGVDQRIYLRAIAVLDEGARAFPDYWKIPYAAGQIYMLDLQTTDPAQRRAWDERGARLLERAVRQPGAPAYAALSAAHLRSRIGQSQRAVDDLREMFLVTNDEGSRKRILEKLAELQEQNADELAAELLEARHQLEGARDRDRSELPISMYILLGPVAAPGFDLTDLATGGRDLIGAEPAERLEPVTDLDPR